MFAVINTYCPPPPDVTTCSAFLVYPFIKGQEWELVVRIMKRYPVMPKEDLKIPLTLPLELYES